MGYYLEVKENRNKAAQLMNKYPGSVLNPKFLDFEDIPESMALICVVNNGAFEAAAVLFNQREFEYWMMDAQSSSRPRQYLFISKKNVIAGLGFNPFR